MTQQIGLIDVDGGKFPNLALMKLSAHRREKGTRYCFFIYNKRAVTAIMSFTFIEKTDHDFS